MMAVPDQAGEPPAPSVPVPALRWASCASLGPGSERAGPKTVIHGRNPPARAAWPCAGSPLLQDRPATTSSGSGRAPMAAGSTGGGGGSSCACCSSVTSRAASLGKLRLQRKPVPVARAAVADLRRGRVSSHRRPTRGGPCAAGAIHERREQRRRQRQHPSTSGRVASGYRSPTCADTYPGNTIVDTCEKLDARS